MKRCKFYFNSFVYYITISSTLSKQNADGTFTITQNGEYQVTVTDSTGETKINVQYDEIKVLDLDPKKERKKLAYNIGTVFGQKEQLWTHLTPYDNFKFFGAIYDIPDYIVEKKITELTMLFELEKFINTPVRNLSLGERIRCEIVASLIHEPKILFLDEPTIGLDPVVKENIRTLIKRMNKEYKTTIFLTSHDISDIEKLCERVIIINNGNN